MKPMSFKSIKALLVPHPEHCYPSRTPGRYDSWCWHTYQRLHPCPERNLPRNCRPLPSLSRLTSWMESWHCHCLTSTSAIHQTNIIGSCRRLIFCGCCQCGLGCGVFTAAAGWLLIVSFPPPVVCRSHWYFLLRWQDGRLMLPPIFFLPSPPLRLFAVLRCWETKVDTVRDKIRVCKDDVDTVGDRILIAAVVDTRSAGTMVGWRCLPLLLAVTTTAIVCSSEVLQKPKSTPSVIKEELRGWCQHHWW